MTRPAVRSRGSAGHLLTAAAVGYVAGTLPSADLAARMATGGRTDLRSAGSGNPGAANAIGVLGPVWGSMVLGSDIGKGAIACRLGHSIAGDAGAHVAGVAAVIGHCFPWHAGFSGGKGVATSAGQCLATFPAYFPVDLAVAAATSTGKWKHKAFTTTAVGCVAWVVGTVVWWKKKWPNLWGPPPGAALTAAAATTSTIIMYKFATARPPTP